MIVPDATTDELETFVKKLFCPGDDVYYKAVQNTPIPVPGTPEVYHTALPQTPLLPHRESVDSSDFTKRDIRHRLDMIKVRLSLLKLQRNEAFANNDKEATKTLIASIDANNAEKVRLERSYYR